MGQVDKLMIELDDLRHAKDLLETLWIYIGPYRTKDLEIPEDLHNKLRDYFKFDDSE